MFLTTNIENQVKEPTNHTKISAAQQPTTTNQSNKFKHKLKPNTQIRYKNNLGDEWEISKITSRAGKATGRYSEWWNTESDDGVSKAIDFSKVKEVEIINTTHLENQVTFTSEVEYQQHGTLISKIEDDTLNAKLSELQQWDERNVYSITEDSGQECISLRWVIKPKIVDGRTITKARLCARGFEEEQNFRTDSPTCSREGIRLALSTIVSHSWTLNSLDVKTAFLQGKPIERLVYVRPPKEAKTDQIWKLNKCVYGLADASRYWYLKIREELLKLKATPCKLDQGIFFWHENSKLIGIIVCFVDDVIWAGTAKFYSIIEQLRKTFHIGAESSKTFKYIGIHMQQDNDLSITINQNNYVDSINPISTETTNPKQSLDAKQKTQLRGALGQLNWLAGISRPEISFYVCEISTRVKSSTVADIIAINKVIKFVKSTPSFIKFPKMHIPSLRIDIFSDASFNNLPDGGSQGAFIIFLCDEYNNSTPICWNSTRIKRVARSTLAAETLALAEGCDSAFFLSQLLNELYKQTNTQTLINAYTDNLSLYETTQTTKQVLDRRLRVEISALREMSSKNEISIHWIEGSKQLSDVLTKKGASHQKLIDTLQDGKISY